MQGTAILPEFSGGANVAIKTPADLFAATVAFYRDTLGLPVIEVGSRSAIFQFGPIRLWVECSEFIKTTETWLELRTGDPVVAARYLETHGVQRCDEVEALPDDFPGFWISSPAGQVHLVCGKDPS